MIRMKNSEKKEEKNILGVTVTRKENFSQWYLEVVRKGGFKDQRTPVKGFDVILPWGYAIWERIQEITNKIFKQHGIQNCYFPMLFPEAFLKKEAEHFEGFKAEAVKVTEVGDEKLTEPLVIRPTSETIMYYMFSKWIRSYRDLPLKINQWCNVVRWDTKVTRPFIRDREFLWQELHTAHATREEALQQINEIIEMCKEIHYYLAMSAIPMRRTPSDTFPGAEFSVAFDTLVQDCKVFQGPGGHFLGQNFAKAFDITFIDEHGRKQYVWQTCLGMTTREIGGIIMQHGDDQGAVLPPLLAPIQFVIIPIPFKAREQLVLNKAKEIYSLISTYVRAHIDLRDYSPGFKFNDWELKGVPFRIEIGPKEAEQNKITIVRRDTGEKIELSVREITKEKLHALIKQMQNDMFERSKRFLETHIINTTEFDEIKENARKGIVRTNWCGSERCEEKINALGVEVRGTRFDKKEEPFDTCVVCGKKAKYVIYAARSY